MSKSVFLNQAVKLKPVKVWIQPDMCISCGNCLEVCPFGLPHIDDEGKYFIKDPENCIECGACKKNCPTFAIVMKEQKGCGCLWDARQRRKNPNSNSSCCG